MVKGKLSAKWLNAKYFKLKNGNGKNHKKIKNS